ncbi:unnamed protein product [Zymoseptoria tritici ST99CH_1A5]|nr:unnamed protein product [Zymoseptoria tritici ST99CH_3D1]SMY23321.1 unnamed protein product [Zymoseptoria tritici ST99CH_1A5]
MAPRPPSTPNARSMRSNVPSTTPAGVPPTWLTDKSNTPAGPPPPSILGSSFNPSDHTFGRKATFQPNSFSMPEDDSDEDDDDAEYEQEYGHEEDNMDEDDRTFRSSLPTTSPRGLKRSRDGRIRGPSSFASIARSMTSNHQASELSDKDNIISQSEALLSELDARVRRQPNQADSILTETSAQLTKLWSRDADTATKQGEMGPQSDDAFTNANYLASLLLQMHHPHTANARVIARGQRPSAMAARPQHATTIPKGLLDWLNTYHQPFPDDYNDVHLHQPAPSAHETFWDVVYASTLRGKLSRAIQLLKDARWEHAATALDDGAPEPGYEGHQLLNTEAVIATCIRTIESCPGYAHNDWDVKGMEWTIFRQRTSSAMQNLDAVAGSNRMDESQAGDNVFQRSQRGSALSLSSASRRAESKVPWSIHQNLKLLYGILLGTTDEVLMTAQDWLEASIYLTIWWDGTDEGPPEASLNRSSMRKSTAQKTREVDVAPLAAYRKRLEDAFALVTENPDDTVFTVNTMDPVQVGLACIMDDSVGNVVRILRRFSMPIAISVMEIAALGNWLPLLHPRSSSDLLGQGFSKEDLLVLSHAPVETNPDGLDRDEYLGEYAEALAKKTRIGESEGWELAVAVLNRLDQAEDAKQRIASLFDRIELTDDARVDKLLNVCDELGQTEQLRDIAERYADSLAESTNSYGLALIYYARAHASAKLKDTLGLLTSLCLLHSASMPAQNNIDPKLEDLIGKDRTALRELAQTDMEAATLLSSHLSGYATLRKFYDLRDQDLAPVPPKQSLKSLTRRREAAAALYVVVKSAADCIPGGLFDPEVETVIPAEGLLALLAETLPLLGGGQRIFSENHIFGLLGVLEDFVASPGRIRENADSLLAASLAAWRDAASTVSGRTRKKKNDLSKSVSSSWDVLSANSVMLQSQGLNGADATLQRAWDWRQGLTGIGNDANIDGETIVGLVREALVREVASGWSGSLNW